MSIIFRLFYQLFSKKVQSIIFTIIFWVKIGHVNYSINYFINYSAKKSLQLFSRLFHTSIIFLIFFDFFYQLFRKKSFNYFHDYFFVKIGHFNYFSIRFFFKTPRLIDQRLCRTINRPGLIHPPMYPHYPPNKPHYITQWSMHKVNNSDIKEGNQEKKRNACTTIQYQKTMEGHPPNQPHYITQWSMHQVTLIKQQCYQRRKSGEKKKWLSHYSISEYNGGICTLIRNTVL